METNLFLSRLILNPRSREVRRDLGDCHEMHRTILKVFPQVESQQVREHFGVLFRLETSRGGEEVSLLVQSNITPDWGRLPADRNNEPYCADAPGDVPNPACKPLIALYDSLRIGQQLVFRLRANPTKRLPILIESRKARERGKRIELRREEDQLAWLVRKAGEHGFRLLGARVNPEQKAIGERASKRLTFGAVVFEGELEITDAGRFRQTLAEGIGSGKAYGFGLLSVAPVRA